MQVTVSARHGHLSEATQQKIVSRLEKLGRFFDRLAKAAVVVELREASSPEVSIQLDCEPRHGFAATAKADELFQALDVVIQKLEQQVKKHKEKLIDRQHESPSMAGEEPTDDDTATEEQ